MNQLLAYIRRLQDAEATLQDAWDAGNIAGALASARREMRELREAMQAEVDRCEALAARELHDTEREIASRSLPRAGVYDAKTDTFTQYRATLPRYDGGGCV